MRTFAFLSFSFLVPIVEDECGIYSFVAGLFFLRYYRVVVAVDPEVPRTLVSVVGIVPAHEEPRLELWQHDLPLLAQIEAAVVDAVVDVVVHALEGLRAVV